MIVDLFDKNGIQTIDSTDNYKAKYRSDHTIYFDDRAFNNIED